MADYSLHTDGEKSYNPSALNEQYQQFVTDNTNQINAMYDSAQASQLAGLESAYNQSLSDMTAQKQIIDNQYNRAANDLAVQYERNRMNNNTQAASNGLNVGTGSQMALAQSGQYNRDFGALRGQQAAAQVEQDRQINNLRMNYQAQVQQAIADNDLARAAALVDEANNHIAQLTNAYNMQYQAEQNELDRQRQAWLDAYNQEQDAWQRQRAERQDALQQQGNMAALLAAAGDYSGYAQMFGLSDSQVGQLQAQWIAANPDAAYQSNMIDPEQYHAITGQYPAGYTPPSAQTGGGKYNPSWYELRKQERDKWNAEHPDQKHDLSQIINDWHEWQASQGK